MARLRQIVASAPSLAPGALLAATLVAGALASALPAAARTPLAATSAHSAPARSLLHSAELWATVDICNAPHHPNTVGIRGSMPSDGHPHDVMYMRFLVQSLDTTTHQWANIGASADSGYVQVGAATLTRQAGRSFEFKPTTTTYTLRGFVEFQWRRAGHTVHAAGRATTTNHTSLAGAEPKGFSAAACELP